MGGETVSNQRRRHGAKFKVRVVLEALKGDKSMGALAGLYQVHPSQIAAWKKRALEGLPELFSNHRAKDRKAEAELKAQLYQQIGKLKVELDWLKKKSGLDT